MSAAATEVIPAGDAGYGGAVIVRPQNPLDANPTEFRGALVRRGDNRKSLIEWIREALVDGVDYGKIHTMKKDRCRHGGPPKCTPELEPYHWSKPSLRKPGAEKICGMLGINPSFPTLKEYENLALQGVEIKSIILRCHLLTTDERVVAEGIGARNVETDYGDLNKALKMAAKSAQIDATLRCAGLSEIFTQDLEDMLPPREPTDPAHDESTSASTGYSEPSANAPRNNAQRAQTQAPRSNGNGSGRCTDKQAKLVGVKLDQAGIPERDFLRQFNIGSIAELPFAQVNNALQWIQDSVQ